MTLAGVACAAVLLTTGTAAAAGQSAPTAGTAVSDAAAALPDTTAGSVDAAVQGGVTAAAKCNLSLGRPWKENIAPSGRSDHARGQYKTVNSCAGYSLVTTLQYHRWHGWSGLASADWVGNRGLKTLQWKCQGKGTFTYRMAGTIRGGLTPGGDPEVRRGYGAERRFAC